MMPSFIPNNTQKIIYYFTKNEEIVENTNLSTIQKLFREAIDKDFVVTEIKCKTENMVLKVS